MIELATPRLRLRPVCDADRDFVVAVGADERVMTTLGGAMTPAASEAWLAREIAHWSHGIGRFAVLHDGAHVGFVGLSRTDLDSGLLPAVEIAWRLAFDAWGHGYATEAARAALADGFGRAGLREIIAVTAATNARSRRVMERLGMAESPAEAFDHPRVAPESPLRRHVLYRVRQ